MLLSSACEYGLRAMLYLASLDREGYVSIKEISNELDISFPFLTKVCQMLARAGLLATYRGPSGGIALTRAPDQITLKEIIGAIDGHRLFQECVLGLPGCGEQKPCPMHARWAVERGRIDAMFSEATLADASNPIRSSKVRLKVSE